MSLTGSCTLQSGTSTAVESRPEKSEACRVLLVDDDPSQFLLVRALLSSISSHQYDVDWTPEFEEGARLISEHRHLAYLIDYQLPGACGLDLIRGARLRESPAAFILMTAYGQPSLGLEALRAGATDFLVKGEFKGPALDRTIRLGIERARSVAAMKRGLERFNLAISGAREGLWDWDIEKQEVFLSPSWKEMIGFADSEIESDLREWLDRVHPEDRQILLSELMAHLEGLTSHFETEYRVRHRDESYLWMLCRGVAIRNADGKTTRIAGCQTDITLRKAAEERLLSQAIHDPLTGLINRRYLMEQLSSQLRSSRRYGYPVSLSLCDIDSFKQVNDRFGHRAGDDVLVRFSSLLKTKLRSEDLIGRFGGDEFCIVLPHTHAADARICLDRVREALEQEVFLDRTGEPFRVTASFGISELSLNHTESDLIEAADGALYQAKDAGRNRIAILA